MHPQVLTRNFVPLPYRRVAVREVDFPLTARALQENLLGREAYRRTEFIVLKHEGAVAIARIVRESDEELFSAITCAELFATTDECVWTDDSSVDVGNPSALAAKARALGVKSHETLIVHGKYEHVNFISHPNAYVVRVIDVVPPEPPKLLTMARSVLELFDDFPALELKYEPIDLVALAREHPSKAYLLPCQASGINLGAPVYFLDTRPAWREWTMIGCERSAQFHRHFYGREPEQVDYCPRLATDKDASPDADVLDLILTKCCLLETTIECVGNRAIVPWGATMRHVQEALRYLAGRAEENVPSVIVELTMEGSC